MEFMLLFSQAKDAPRPGPEGFAEMGRFAAELSRHGKLRCGAPLGEPADGATVRSRDGKPLVSDGPFAEAKEVLGGFWIIDAASRDEAIDIARRCPHARGGTVEVHAVRRRYLFDDTGAGTPFLFAFHRVPGLTDPDDSKFRAMMTFAETLAHEGTLFETTPLAVDPPPARIEPRDGKPLVLDGPFAEAKEAVGGYSLVRVPDRAAAVELATRYPHAAWGPIEVREILFFDPV